MLARALGCPRRLRPSTRFARASYRTDPSRYSSPHPRTHRGTLTDDRQLRSRARAHG